MSDPKLANFPEEQIQTLPPNATRRRRVFESFLSLDKVLANMEKNAEFTRILEVTDQPFRNQVALNDESIVKKAELTSCKCERNRVDVFSILLFLVLALLKEANLRSEAESLWLWLIC